MLMSLEQFVFSLTTVAHQELQRQTQWRHAKNSRVNARPGTQYVGPGEDTITLTGAVLPELGHSLEYLEELRSMGDRGQGYVLVDGAGYVYGTYVIENLSTTASYIRANGVPRKVQFSLSLSRTDDNRASTMADSEGLT